MRKCTENFKSPQDKLRELENDISNKLPFLCTL